MILIGVSRINSESEFDFIREFLQALAVKNYLTVSFFDLMHELDVFEHQYVSASVAFISFYMGVASFFLTPKNELARTYLRAYVSMYVYL